jgi:hypothetical protein
MHWLAIVGLSLLVLAAAALFELLTGLWWVRVLFLGTAIWATWDSRRLELRRYPHGEAFHPTWVFWGVVGAWPLVFPWYIVYRRRIRSGRAERGPAFHDDDVVY